MEEQLADYPSLIHFPLEWGDMDACGIINNVKYFRYFENGRINYLDKVGLSAQEPNTGNGLVAAASSAQYIKPLTYPDNITIGTRVKKIGNSSLIMESILYSEKQGVAATGEVVVVMYDFNNVHKINLPQKAIALINELECKHN